MEEKYLTINNLQIYKLARELSKEAWVIYSNLDWLNKKS